jgi:phosphoribosylanthranilate isomerase
MNDMPKMEDITASSAPQVAPLAMIDEPADDAVNTATVVTTKKKKVTKKTSAKGEMDLIVQVAHEIENLDKEAALAQGRQIQSDTDFNLFKIGGILAVVRENAWYSEYETFQKYVEAEFSTLSRSPYRKARYLMAIYNALVESGVKWEKVSSIGWTKLSVIAGKLTPENVDEWIKIATERTVIQLQQHIKELDAGEHSGDDVEPPEKSDLTIFSIKVHADQKENIKQALEKSKQEFGTPFDAVALDHIVMGYMTGSLGKAKKSPTFRELMLANGPEAVLNIFGEVFPNVNISAELPGEGQYPTEDEIVEASDEIVEDTVEVGETKSEGILAEDDVLLEEEV